jgi:hypothetical protein
MARSATPFRRRPQREDLDIHIPVVEFLGWAWPEQLPWWHTPNGEQREIHTARKLKRMGVRAGVPDLVFILPNGQAAFIELKVPGKETTGGQDDFIELAKDCGCGVAICYSVEDVQAVLTRWLAIFGMKLRARTGSLI